MKKHALKYIAITILALMLVGCQSTSSTNKQDSAEAKRVLVETPYEDTQFLMGTVVQIKIYDKNKQKVVTKSFDRVKELAKKITVNQKGSEVDKVNKNAGIKPVKVTADIYNLIEKAVYYSKNSQGSFDLAVGPITSLWHIGFPDAKKPTQAEIDKVLPLVDYQQVQLNKTESTVYLRKKGMQLDLGGIAKGYITDEIVKLLKINGVTTAIVDLGGNIYVLGHSPKGTNKQWTVGIQDPKAARGTSMGTIPAANKTIVTSGIYERYLKVNGKIYMHLMNPKTGYPFDTNLMGVSIIADKSVDGDAMSTATFDKGLKKGLAYVESKKGVEAIFITKAKKVYITSGLKDDFSLLSGQGYSMGKASDYE